MQAQIVNDSIKNKENKENKEKKQKISKHSSNQSEINYKRSSLFTLMIYNESITHSDIIRTTFINKPIPEKFNNHNLNNTLIPSTTIRKDQSKIITTYLLENDIAKKMVSKWFNRNNKGEFDMQLIIKRGNYNATDLDIIIAKNTERGESILADAGEELIGNTFVIVNDYKYTNKEEVAKKAGGFLKLVANVAANTPGGQNISTAANLSQKAIKTAGKGYIIKTTSYLYKLIWNEEIAAIFYNDYWIDSENFSINKKEAFDKSSIFKLEYIGSQNAWADIQSSIYSNKSNQELIQRATIKASDKAIAKLQRKYDKFKTKSPIISINPVAAKIGLKEGIKKGDKFEVLEQVLNKKGKIEFKRVAVITVNKKHIWDNRYMANEEHFSKFEYTTFKGGKKALIGMFLRQLN
jgi:hypothetical protein